MGSGRIDPYYEWLGIQPSEQPVDFYRLLGIARFEDNPTVIERAADRQMGFIRQFQVKHPAEVADLLGQLSLARITLINGEKKQLYDGALKNGQHFSSEGRCGSSQFGLPEPTPKSPDDAWYFQSFGIPHGPFAIDDLRKRIKAKEVRADTMVRNGSSGRWVLAREVPRLFDLLVSSPPAPGVVSQPKVVNLAPITEKPDLLSGPLPAPEERSPGKNVWVCPQCRWPVPKPKTHCARCGFVKGVRKNRRAENLILVMLFLIALAIIAVAIALLIKGS